MRFVDIAAFSLLLLPGLATAQSGDGDPFVARARALMRAHPFIDTHNDLPEMLRLRADYDLTKFDPNGPLP